MVSTVGASGSVRRETTCWSASTIDRGGGHDRVASVLRVSGMAAAAGHRDGHVVEGSVHRAGRRGYLADRNPRLYVCADDGSYVMPGQLRGLDEILGAERKTLLPRLQQGQHGDRQVQGSGRSGERGQGSQMYVVAARVHRAIRRCPRHPGPLDNRQSVQLGSYGDGRTVRRPDSDDPALGHRRRVRLPDRRRDQRRRRLLVPAGARLRVHLPTQVLRVRQLGEQRGRPVGGQTHRPYTRSALPCAMSSA
nr:hypothetical protein [Fodinicola feengrottensis]